MTSEASRVTGGATPLGRVQPFRVGAEGLWGMRWGLGGDGRPLLPVSQCAGVL